MNYDLIVIGSGPGGYVAAIRASQLGMKVGVVERSEIGGICLNWGCIPTKSLLKSAQVYNYMKHASDYGIDLEQTPVANIEKMVIRSREVAAGMSKGIQYLFKKNKIEHIEGTGKLLDNKTVTVTDNNHEAKNYTAKHIILATGGRSRQLDSLRQDGEKNYWLPRSFNFEKIAQKHGCSWLGSNWQRVCVVLPKYWY